MRHQLSAVWRTYPVGGVGTAVTLNFEGTRPIITVQRKRIIIVNSLAQFRLQHFIDSSGMEKLNWDYAEVNFGLSEEIISSQSFFESIAVNNLSIPW